MDRDERFEAEAIPHLRALYGTAYRMTRNAHDAEDLVQETFLRAYRAFDRFTAGTNIRAWLYTILHRVRTDAFRRAARSPSTMELTGDGPAVPAGSAGALFPSETAMKNGARARARAEAARVAAEAPGGTGSAASQRMAFSPAPRKTGPTRAV